eukprot:918887-Prymnesium_polylepis.2
MLHSEPWRPATPRAPQDARIGCLLQQELHLLVDGEPRRIQLATATIGGAEHACLQQLLDSLSMATKSPKWCALQVIQGPVCRIFPQQPRRHTCCKRRTADDRERALQLRLRVAKGTESRLEALSEHRTSDGGRAGDPEQLASDPNAHELRDWQRRRKAINHVMAGGDELTRRRVNEKI